MKFSVGYQQSNSGVLIDTIIKNKLSVNEVYFAYKNFANGRSNAINDNIDYLNRQLCDLKKLSTENVPLNLLLNGNCYGVNSLSTAFYDDIYNTISELIKVVNLKCVTTTSPLIASFIKKSFKNVKTRASINMEIGEVSAFEYLKNEFDGFYLKREYNRDINKIKQASNWCKNNGKELYGLANSGCLNYCSARTFHDNLVSHEGDFDDTKTYLTYEGQCFTFLKDAINRNEYLKYTNFIRPEDVYLYEEYFNGLKLATRVNKSAVRILKAYLKGSYSGSINELLEPNHASLFFPKLIENKLIDSNFTNYTLNCNKNCDTCGYCKKVTDKAIITLKGDLC